MRPRYIAATLLAFCSLAATAANPALPKPDITVAADGSGDFKMIQAALATIPMTNRERTVILVKNGIYHEKIRVDAPSVTLRGESRSGTRIEFPQLNDDFTKAPDKLGRAVINLSGTADDFVLENLTAENTAGVVGPHAFTIYGRADRTVIVNCDVLSHGADTVSLWLADRGRYYHANCRFEGSVDFVCPRGWCYVTNCTLYEMKSGSAAVWHDGHVNRDMKFVLRDCRFDGTNGWVLARHHMDAQFYFLGCSFSGTMADKAPLRVVYPDDPNRNAALDKSNLWGERAYFYDCHRGGGDFAWFADNLTAAPDSPKPEQMTAAWTFAGKWNPERRTGPMIQKLTPEGNQIAIRFSESVTVKGKPRLVLGNRSFANYVSGSGTDALQFALPSEETSEVVSLELNGGFILASEADAEICSADLTLPRETGK